MIKEWLIKLCSYFYFYSSSNFYATSSARHHFKSLNIQFSLSNFNFLDLGMEWRVCVWEVRMNISFTKELILMDWQIKVSHSPFISRTWTVTVHLGYFLGYRMIVVELILFKAFLLLNLIKLFRLSTTTQIIKWWMSWQIYLYHIIPSRFSFIHLCVKSPRKYFPIY